MNRSSDADKAAMKWNGNMRSCFWRGYKDGDLGRTSADNPYDGGGYHNAWDNGWIQGHVEWLKKPPIQDVKSFIVTVKSPRDVEIEVRWASDGSEHPDTGQVIMVRGKYALKARLMQFLDLMELDPD